jgi:hypothetical protein
VESVGGDTHNGIKSTHATNTRVKYAKRKRSKGFNKRGISLKYNESDPSRHIIYLLDILSSRQKRPPSTQKSGNSECKRAPRSCSFHTVSFCKTLLAFSTPSIVTQLSKSLPFVTHTHTSLFNPLAKFQRWPLRTFTCACLRVPPLHLL